MTTWNVGLVAAGVVWVVWVTAGMDVAAVPPVDPLETVEDRAPEAAPGFEVLWEGDVKG